MAESTLLRPSDIIVVAPETRGIQHAIKLLQWITLNSKHLFFSSRHKKITGYIFKACRISILCQWFQGRFSITFWMVPGESYWDRSWCRVLPRRRPAPVRPRAQHPSRAHHPPRQWHDPLRCWRDEKSLAPTPSRRGLNESIARSSKQSLAPTQSRRGLYEV